MRYVGLVRRDNLRSHFVFWPRHAPEWLCARFLPVVFLTNEEELTGKTFTMSLTTTNLTFGTHDVKFIFLQTSPLKLNLSACSEGEFHCWKGRNLGFFKSGNAQFLKFFPNPCRMAHSALPPPPNPKLKFGLGPPPPPPPPHHSVLDPPVLGQRCESRSQGKVLAWSVESYVTS